MKPPCVVCDSMCCRKRHNQSDCGEQNVAVTLYDEDVRRFSHIGLITTRENDVGIPYDEKGNCVFLDDGMEVGKKCSLVKSDRDDRPINCKRFDCSVLLDPEFDETNIDKHGFFLRDNPQLISVILRFNKKELIVKNCLC